MTKRVRMLSRVGAARLLGCSVDLIAKAVEDGRIQCAWVFNEDGKLVRRVPGPGVKKTSQGMHFFEDEIRQYKVSNRVGIRYDFSKNITLNDDRPDIYTSQGVAKILGLTYVRILAIFKDSAGKRLSAHYYDKDGVLRQRSLNSDDTRGKVALFFGEDVEKIKILPRGRPIAPPATDDLTERKRQYYRDYYTRTQGRTRNITAQQQ